MDLLATSVDAVTNELCLCRVYSRQRKSTQHVKTKLRHQTRGCWECYSVPQIDGLVQRAASVVQCSCTNLTVSIIVIIIRG